MRKIDINVIDYLEEHAEKLSEIIIRNLTEINRKDYSEEKINELVLKFSPEKIIELGKQRKIFVATFDSEVAGTLSVQKSWDNEEGSYVFLTIFVLPEFHRKGIGKKLIEKGESYVREINGTKIAIPSSITSHEFYSNLGYTYKDNSKEPNSYGCISMVKVLEENKEIANELRHKNSDKMLEL